MVWRANQTPSVHQFKFENLGIRRAHPGGRHYSQAAAGPYALANAYAVDSLWTAFGFDQRLGYNTGRLVRPQLLVLLAAQPFWFLGSE